MTLEQGPHAGDATPPGTHAAVGSVIHVGLHKTATTSLQKNLFRSGSRPYVGLHGDPEWLESRKAWLPVFTGKAPLPAGAPVGPFVFSDESILLRAGLAGVDTLARAIRERFPAPKVLVTVRKPSSLLVSAYFQSPRLRRIAIGFRDARPLHPTSLRFHTFGQWWELMEAHRDTSLSGLLAYDRVEAAFVAALGSGNVEVLPIEWIRSTPAAYAAGLSRLGFTADESAAFLSADPENVRATKVLDKVRPWAFATGAWIGRHGLEGAAARISQSRLRPVLDRVMHFPEPPPTLVGAPRREELEAIDARYGAAWRTIMERAPTA